MLLICRDNTVKYFCPLTVNAFHDFIGQVSHGVFKVDGLDIDVGVEGVLVEENPAASIMGHVEAIRKKLVVNVGQTPFAR